MKGTIVSAWVETSRNLYGNKITDEALESVHISPDKIFKPTEEIDDSVAFGFIQYLSRNLNIPIDQMWETIGRNNVLTYSKRYPSFFKYRNLYSFLNAMYDIHVIVTERIPGAKPPILDIKPVDEFTAHMTYESPRGMFSFFKGMLAGATEFFNEDVDVEVLEQTNTFLKISIKFQEQIYYEKDFKLNKILSLGFIKSLAGKLAFSSLVFVGLPSFLSYKFLSEPFNIIVGLLISLLLPFLIAKKLFEPIKVLDLVIANLADRNLAFSSHINSKDEFQSLNENLEDLKKVLREDFVGYKGSTDELNVFADNFEGIASNMADRSMDINSIIEGLSGGVTTQANTTDDLSDNLNQSIDSLNQIVEREEEGKNQLEDVVKEINSSFMHLKETTENLNQVLVAFSGVESSGKSLQDKAEEVMQIVEAVDKIAEQTNLLALNASIEASRAGEFGAGFSVVAMEIRELAEDSKLAVSTINNNLSSFVSDIDSFVMDISKQFSVLENENKSLNLVAEENNSSVNSIEEVSDMINDITSELTSEADKLNYISENIRGLAEIAQENSSYSKQVYANIEGYTAEIKSMTQNISEFKELSAKFSEDLENYRM